MDKVKSSIDLLGIKEEKNALDSHYLENKGEDITLKLSAPYYYTLSGQKRDSYPLNSSELTKEDIESFFSSISSVSLNNKKGLTLEEQKERLMFIRDNLLNDDFTKTKTFDRKIEKFYDNYVLNLKKEFKKLTLTDNDSLNDLNTSWFIKDYSREEIKNSVRFIKMMFLERKETKSELIEYLNKEINKILNLKILDIPFDELFLLDFTLTIDEIVKTNKLYRIEKYKLFKRSMGANGEHLTYKPVNDESDLIDIIVANGYYQNGRSIFLAKNTSLFTDENKAVEKGLENVKRIKNIIDQYNVAKF